METEGQSANLDGRMAGIERETSDLRAEMRALRADMRSDFRTTFGALIVVALGLAGLMARGFGWL